MLAWKHHIAENFETGKSPLHPNGAGKGATILLNYHKMLEYLLTTKRRWYICEIEVSPDELLFEFGNDYMATILVDRLSEKGFRPV